MPSLRRVGWLYHGGQDALMAIKDRVRSAYTETTVTLRLLATSQDCCLLWAHGPKLTEVDEVDSEIRKMLDDLEIEYRMALPGCYVGRDGRKLFPNCPYSCPKPKW
jgi:hypothetical protein